MKNKVVVIRHGIVHYVAGCNDCDFTDAITGNDHERNERVRASVYRHVKETGHTCWIESGTHTTYTAVPAGS